MRYFFITLLMFLVSLVSFAQNIVDVKSSNDLLTIGENLEYFEDIDGKLTIQDILSPQINEKFKSSDKELFVRRPTKSAYWFKISINNQTQEDIWLSLGNTTAQYLDFYAPDSLGNYNQPHQTGRLRPHDSKFYDILTDFWIPLNKGGKKGVKTYYLRLQQSALMRYKFKVGTFKTLSEDKIPIDTLNAIFLGWMLIMVLYNSFLFLFTRDVIYLYYVGYLISITLTATYISSYPVIDFLLNYQYTYFLSSYYPVWNYPAFIFTVLFCIKYLDLKTYLKRTEKFLYLCIVLYLILVFLPSSFSLFPNPIIILFLQLITLSTYLTCLLISIYLLFFKKQKRAVYYALGWSFYFIGLFIFITRTSNLFPNSIYVQKSFLFGIAMETWMFSLALGRRLNILKEEKEKAQAKNLKLVQEQNELLERTVKQRTKKIEHQKEELRLNNEKLLTQEEELRQNLEELTTTQEFLEEKQTEVIQKTLYIEKLYGDLNESIEYAKSIQETILPTNATFESKLPNSFILFKPRDIVSGDFYYLKEVKQKVVLAAVDCTGHGVPGAFMSLIGNDLLGDIVVGREILEADKILNQLHVGIRTLLRQEETKNRDGMDIALVVWDKKEHTLEFAGAKNPLIYIQDNQLQIIKGDKVEIGGEQREQKRSFTKHQISLDKKTTFYLFSDGFQDQFGGEKEKKFMRNKFYNLLLEHHKKEMKTQKETLNKTLEDWQGNLEQVDDILIIGVSI